MCHEFSLCSPVFLTDPWNQFAVLFIVSSSAHDVPHLATECPLQCSIMACSNNSPTAASAADTPVFSCSLFQKYRRPDQSMEAPIRSMAMAMPNGGVERLRAPYPDVLPFGLFVAVGDTDVADGPAYGVSFLVPCIHQRFTRNLSARTQNLKP